ncbi:PTS sugar transporter subunit IIC [Clostridium sp. NSJ-145]|uniref:PTS sugar transporter subunit IIC n=1 Tax=Clostridium sp. NSJ-145 TaxID=2897777 RepID=UPI001E393D4D|nr:PTS sugar transporter subunit IIC [Clostridium sp. NSJ-145]MCD2503152.1 PTS sugar transporter subunit IIC [Clostridium sp. NSJ-145]
MKNVNGFLEEKLLPIAAKLGNNKILIAIRDGITLSMPLIIIGSLFLVLASFPIEAWTNWLAEIGVDGYLWKGVDSSFGLMGLIASFGVANSLARQYKVDGVSAGVISLSSFIVITPFSEGGIPVGYMGSKGLFVAMVIGIISALIFQWFINHNIQIKLPDAVPPAVARSFSALIPGAAIITLWLVIYGILDKVGIGNAHDLLAIVLGGPLGLLGNNIFGTLIAILLNSLFWFIGIHGGNVVNSILSPIWLINSDANRLIFQADKFAELPNIITAQFIDNFVFMGGGGATIGLVIVIAIMARRRKASQITKTMAPLTLTPGLFNINEPAMFGIPIVMNVSLLIPFILAPVANALICYFAMAAGIAAKTTGISVSWTMPPIISGFLTTGGHISGSILQIVCIIVDIAIYWGFYRTVEKQNLELESADNTIKI